MLPSQTTRSSDRRRYMYRNQGSRRWPMLLGGLAGVALIVLFWQLVTPGGDDAPDDRIDDSNLVARAGDDDAATASDGGTPFFPMTSTSDGLNHRLDGGSEAGSDAGSDGGTPATPPPTPPAAAGIGEQAGHQSPARSPAGSPGEQETHSIAMGDPQGLPGPDDAAGTSGLDAGSAGRDDSATPPAGRRETVAPAVAAPEPRAPQPERFEARPVSAALHEAEMLLRQNRAVEARSRLSRALGSAAPADRAEIRAKLASINERLVFSPEIVPEDEYARPYVLQSGDSLSKVVKRMSLQVDWRFLARINGIPLERAHLVRAGDTIKVVTGPFHAVVDKSDHRLDLYLGDIADREKVYVRSFDVGLGAHNKTPLGRFRVKKSSKLINPEWIHPHTRQRFAPDDPLNPIGERWIGLVGIDEATKDMYGYGIHGTIEPESIGRNASMGCVRLLPEDVKIIYEVMMEGVSVVQVVE